MSVLPPGPGKHAAPDVDQALNPWLERHLWELGRDGPVLDLGCGRGYWLRRMRSAGLRPVGIEHDQDRTADALRQAPVAVADGAELPFADTSVGLVWCIHVLHHLEEPDRVLREVRRVLRPGGHLILAETVEDNPLIRAGRSLWPAWDGVHVHSRFTADRLLRMLGAAGFSVTARRQHSLVSFGAWALPVGDRQAWTLMSRAESFLPAAFDRWGAHLECVAQAPTS